MLRIYTGYTAADVANIIVDIRFPENGLAPYEQVDWIKNNYKRDISFVTFSPYIMNYLNVLLAKNELNENNLEVHLLWTTDEDSLEPNELQDNDLIVTDVETGWKIVDTSDLSEPISVMYAEYNQLRPHQNK